MRYLTVITLLLGMILPNDRSCSAAKDSNDPIMGNADTNILVVDLPKIKQEALEGSSASALRLHQYYRFIKFDIKESYFWATVGAENGSDVAQYIVGSMILDADCTPLRSVMPDDLTSKTGKYARVVYWFKLAAKSGNYNAQHALTSYLANGLPKSPC